MKLIIAIFLFMSHFAQASQEECIVGIQEANRKYKGEVEIIFADMKNLGHWLFFRMKKDHKPTLNQSADINRAGRICMQAGFSKNLYTGVIGQDKPLKSCTVTNMNTLSMVCDLYTRTGPLEIIKIKN